MLVPQLPGQTVLNGIKLGRRGNTIGVHKRPYMLCIRHSHATKRLRPFLFSLPPTPRPRANRLCRKLLALVVLCWKGETRSLFLFFHFHLAFRKSIHQNTDNQDGFRIHLPSAGGLRATASPLPPRASFVHIESAPLCLR